MACLVQRLSPSGVLLGQTGLPSLTADADHYLVLITASRGVMIGRIPAPATQVQSIVSGDDGKQPQLLRGIMTDEVPPTSCLGPLNTARM